MTPLEWPCNSSASLHRHGGGTRYNFTPMGCHATSWLWRATKPRQKYGWNATMVVCDTWKHENSSLCLTEIRNLTYFFTCFQAVSRICSSSFPWRNLFSKKSWKPAPCYLLGALKIVSTSLGWYRFEWVSDINIFSIQKNHNLILNWSQFWAVWHMQNRNGLSRF